MSPGSAGGFFTIRATWEASIQPCAGTMNQNGNKIKEDQLGGEFPKFKYGHIELEVYLCSLGINLKKTFMYESHT